MPLRVNPATGATEVITDEHAEGLAVEAMNRIDAAVAHRDYWGSLSDRDTQRMVDDFREAERLVQEVEDHRKLYAEPLQVPIVNRPRYVPPVEDRSPRLTISAERAQRIADAYRQIVELGHDDPDGADDDEPVTNVQRANAADDGEAETPGTTVTEPPSRKANVKRDRARNVYVVTGAGKHALEFASLDLAEREARRRVGLFA